MSPSLSRGLRCARFAALAFAGALGCETQPTHEVLAVTDLSPRQVEVGDRVVLHGSGFPLPGDIRRISVRLAAMLARPGAAPCPRPVVVTLNDPPEEGRAVDPFTGAETEAVYAASNMHTIRVDGGARVEFVMTEELLRALTTCPGERASLDVAHTTLSLVGSRAGVSVRVETMQGTTLASARALRGPRLDVLAPWGRTLEVERAARGVADRALDFMGLRLAAVNPPEGGLQVERVAPGSPADEAGIADGDVLERIDGATLLGVSDFRPSLGSDVSVVTVRRGDAVDDRPVHVTPLTRGAPTDLVATAVLVLSGLALLWVSASWRRGTLGWLASRLARTPASGAARATAPLEGTLPARALALVRARFMATPESTALAFAAVSTTALALPFGQALFVVDVDVAFAQLAVTLATLAVTALAARAVQRASLASTLRAMARRLALELPAACALVAAVALSGEIRALEITATQGGAPWAWNLVRNPALFVLGAGSFLSLVTAAPASRGDAPRWLRIVAWSALVARAALVAALFLGGPMVPGVDASSQATTVALQMVGAALLTAKAWALVGAARWLSPRVEALPAALLTTLSLRHAAPAAVIAAALVAAGEVAMQALPHAGWDVAATVASLATFAVAATTAGVVTRRRLSAARAIPAGRP